METPFSKGNLKIYFCGSIRGGRQDQPLYQEIVTFLKQWGKVLTEHVAYPDLTTHYESNMTDDFIHTTDMNYLKESEVVIAETTVVSMGVGYEIGRAVEQKKPILALFRTADAERRVSAMVSGCPDLTFKEYTTAEEAKTAISAFMNAHFPTKN